MKETVAGHKLALVLDWQGDRLVSMNLAWASDAAPSAPATAFGRSLEAALKRYEAGQPPAWPEPPVDLEALPRFHRAVLEALRKVGPGQAVSYGGLAAACGHPGAARAVGQVMARNPWPLLYPCHRVLAAGGRIGGFGPGPEMKRYLLELEGFHPK